MCSPVRTWLTTYWHNFGVTHMSRQDQPLALYNFICVNYISHPHVIQTHSYTLYIPIVYEFYIILSDYIQCFLGFFSDVLVRGSQPQRPNSALCECKFGMIFIFFARYLHYLALWFPIYLALWFPILQFFATQFRTLVIPCSPAQKKPGIQPALQRPRSRDDAPLWAGEAAWSRKSRVGEFPIFVVSNGDF
jgi:hypothetical protein